MDENLVFDVGLHKGEDSDFYLRKGFRVVAVEASSELAQTTAQRLQSAIAEGRLNILNVAVAASDGPLTFWVNPAVSVWGTANIDFMERNKRNRRPSVAVTIEGRNFAGILREHGIPYYLKVDIEGFDMLCVQALREFQSRPRYISVESTQSSWEDLLKEFAVFKELGYTKFKVVPQHMVLTQRCPNPAREGKYVEQTFGDNASGLFGEEAPGEWVDETEALRQYRKIFSDYKWRGADSFLRRIRLIPRLIRGSGWYDTHAALG